MVISNTFRNSFKILLTILVMGIACQINAQTLDDYRLGSDDVISVSVFDEPDLSLKEARVSSSYSQELTFALEIAFQVVHWCSRGAHLL